MKTKRRYVMRARAEAVEQTKSRILRAAFDLSWEKPSFTLDDVADRAEVSVQTIIRHFGSRDGLYDSLLGFGQAVIAQERAAPPGDVAAVVSALFDHYEQRGDATMRMLGQELWDERIRRITDIGRKGHREWVERAFVPQLDSLRLSDREALIDLLVIATDVYTWKLLRRDRALARRAAEQRVRDLISAVLSTAGEAG